MPLRGLSVRSESEDERDEVASRRAVVESEGVGGGGAGESVLRELLFERRFRRNFGRGKDGRLEGVGVDTEPENP